MFNVVDVPVKRVFLNCVNHKLITEQVEKAKKLFNEIVELKDVNPDLFSKLSSMDINDDFTALAEEFIFYLLDFKERKEKEYNSRVVVYVHFPIGAPIFQFLVAMGFGAIVAQECFEFTGIIFTFSFTKREVIEERKEDGSIVKTSVFKFIDFRFVPIGEYIRIPDPEIHSINY